MTGVDAVVVPDGIYEAENTTDGNHNLEWDASQKHLAVRSFSGQPENCIIRISSDEGDIPFEWYSVEYPELDRYVKIPTCGGFLLDSGQDLNDVIHGFTITGYDFADDRL